MTPKAKSRISKLDFIKIMDLQSVKYPVKGNKQITFWEKTLQTAYLIKNPNLDN